MSKQGLSSEKMSWDDFDEMLRKGRNEVKDIDHEKHLLNKMSVSSGGDKLFEDERKDEIINKGE